MQRKSLASWDCFLTKHTTSTCPEHMLNDGSVRAISSCRYSPDKGVPFYPNPFLPLLYQRRIALLGTQMQCFAGEHILFGRSWDFQGAAGPAFHQSAQIHRTMRLRRLANSVEIYLNLRQVSNLRFGLFALDYGKNRTRKRQNPHEIIGDAVVRYRPYS